MFNGMRYMCDEEIKKGGWDGWWSGLGVYIIPSGFLLYFLLFLFFKMYYSNDGKGGRGLAGLVTFGNKGVFTG